MNRYRIELDILKGLAIIAVVLYHLGILPYGYLGVDTFLVINGFLIIPSLMKSSLEANFSFGNWLVRRIGRFLPIVIVASVVCLTIGYFVMIPDDYENLSESTFASLFFGQNVLSAITTKDYWNSVNEYRPLMHFWYLGVIVQFYFFLAILLSLYRRYLSAYNTKRYLMILLGVLCIASLILYLCPISFNTKFYYLPFRIWEFCIGGIIGIIMLNKEIKISRLFSIACIVFLLILYSFSPQSFAEIDTITIIGAEQVPNMEYWSKELLCLLTVLLSSILLFRTKKDLWGRARWFAIIGKMSLSIFVWHQILLAFIRYCFVDKISINIFVIFIIILAILSYISYKVIEPLKINTIKSWSVVLLSWFIVLIYSFSIYKRGGVVRDVPELGITKDHPLAYRNTDYIDRIYEYNRPFVSSDKIKVLVVGNSFARDFACVLLEWDVNHSLELSYLFSFDECIDNRLSECNYMFVFGSKEQVPQNVWNKIREDCKVYGIGTKSYGKSFGRVYAQRNKPDYYQASIPIHPLCSKINDEWRKSWNGLFIDFMKASQLEDGTIRLFTDNNKVISFDCRHLTMYGCKYYAKVLNLEKIFSNPM